MTVASIVIVCLLLLSLTVVITSIVMYRKIVLTLKPLLHTSECLYETPSVPALSDTASVRQPPDVMTKNSAYGAP